ncbi:MAG: CotH kinase family protein [Saprospiraceae bacterium]|nr:CotH kinase family protein [Saprospiraceae bacterium]
MKQTRRFRLPAIAGLLLCMPLCLFAQLRLNEVAAVNTDGLADEDGEYSDWIELLNTGSQALSTAQHFLSDAAGQPQRWPLPTVVLLPGERRLIFASGKNRPAGTGSGIDHWETALQESDTWQYAPGSPAIPPDWAQPGFDAATWLSGPGGFGYGDGDDATPVAPGTLSVFSRLVFNVPDKNAIAAAILHVDYDDGFVAYLNGTEIARAGLTGQPPAWDELASEHEAELYNGGLPVAFPLDAASLQNLLLDGANVLAVEVHNLEAGSSDLSLRTFLHVGLKTSAPVFGPNPAWFVPPGGSGSVWHTNFKIKSGETLWLRDASGGVADSITLAALQAGHVQARIPDGGAWCLSQQPTPGDANDAMPCFQGYTAAPVFSKAAGFYPSALQVSLSCPTPGAVIHYDLAGNAPTTSSPEYGPAGPFNLSSGVRPVRARAYAPGYLPSPVVTHTYAIGEQSSLPVVFMTTNPDYLFDYNTGIYELGPNAESGFPYYGANFWQGWERPASIEYFPTMQTQGFAQNVGIEIHGNWMKACEQKSFDLKAKDLYGKDEFDYPLFPEKPWVKRFDKFVLRNAGNDNNFAHIRDAIVQTLGAGTHADYVATDLAVLYINGEYWGIYQVYEAHDEYFPENNAGIDRDNVDIVRMFDSGTQAQVGDTGDWQAFMNFVQTQDLSETASFDTLRARYLDVDNYIDYIFTGVYCGNWDWLPGNNNVKAWHRRAPYGRWRYILWDNDFSFGQGSYDLLASLTDDSFANEHEALFWELVDNPEFRRLFINRSCDLLNTVFLPVAVQAARDHIGNRMQPEMPRHIARWPNTCYYGFGPYTYDDWYYRAYGEINYHVDQRPAQLWSQYIEHFDLVNEITIALEVDPPGAGVVQISTIVPDKYPWSGVYLAGNPVAIKAIPAPGYTFSHWSPSALIPNVGQPAFSADVPENTTFRAHFTGAAANLDLTVSEINYHNHATLDAGNWVELHHFGTQTRDLSGYRLQSSGQANGFSLPAGTSMEPGDYLVLAEDLLRFQARHPGVGAVIGPTGVAFGNAGDTLRLLDPAGVVRLKVPYSDDLPWPQCADGQGRTLESAFPEDAQHLHKPEYWFDGCLEGSPGQGYVACAQPLVINEINYKSPPAKDAGDWIECWNRSGGDLDLSGWTFADNNDAPGFVFPAGTLLPKDSFLVLFANLAKFQSVHPAVPGKLGPFPFGLSGNGEFLRLFDATGRLQQSVFYNDAAPWPKAPDGQGPTLALRDPAGRLNDPANWEASCAFGTPGRPNSDCALAVLAPALASIRVHPNPASGRVWIESPDTPLRRWLLRDGLGRLVQEGRGAAGSGHWEISVAGLMPGVYWLEVQAEAGVLHQRLIKN